MAKDDPNSGLTPATKDKIDQFIKEKKIDLKIYSGTEQGNKGLTIYGITPEEARKNIQQFLAEEQTAKARFAKGFSGSWWSDIKTYLEVFEYGAPRLLKSEDDFIGPEEYVVRGRFIKNPVAKIEQTQEETDKEATDIAQENQNVVDAKSYQWRQIAGFATKTGLPPTDNELATIDPSLFVIDDTGVGRFDSNRWQPGGNVRFRTRGMPGLYRGSSLTDEQNRLSRKEYNTNETAADTRIELMKLNSSGQLLAVLTELKRVGGFYNENTEISSQAKNKQGYLPEDQLAFNRFLEYSNVNLKTWEAMMPVLANMGSHKTSGGASFRGDSEADITAYLNEASLALTGEKLTKAKLKQAIANVQAEAKASFRSGTTGASSSVLAEQQVLKSNPAQATSYGLGNAIQLAFEALGS